MLLAIIILNKFVVKIPVVSLAAVMIVVSFSTINWGSLKRISKVPKSDTLVMVSTVLVVLFTHNLAYGVIVGIMISAIAFTSKISDINVEKNDINGHVKYDVNSIDINFTNVKVWDESAVDAIDKVVIKYHKNNIKTNLIGLSDSCMELIDNMATYNKPGGLEVVSSH